MGPRGRAVTRGAGAAAIVLLAGSLLPFWTRWYVGPNSERGYADTLWEAAGQLPAARREIDSDAELFAQYRADGVATAILFAVTAAVGWGVYRWQRTGAAGWGWGVAGITAVAAVVVVAVVVVGRTANLRPVHVLPLVLLLGYSLLLVLAEPVDAEPGQPSGEIDRLVGLKRRGVLLPSHRPRRRRAWFARPPAPADDAPTEPLDRLVAAKQRISPPAGVPDVAPDRRET